MSNIKRTQLRPVVLGGPATWAPQGGVRWDRWGGTAPSWDVARNSKDPDAVVWPQHRLEDGLNLARAVEGPWAFNGPMETELTEVMAARKGVEHYSPVMSGSVALYVAYTAMMHWAQIHGRRVVGVPEVIMTALTFHATGSMAAMCGLKPVVIDVEPGEVVPSVEAFRRAVTPNTVGLTAVAMYDQITPLDELGVLADELDLWLAVDGAHAPFGQWNGAPFATRAHVVTDSYQLGKVLTCGEGGAVSTNDPLIAALCRMAIIGKTPDPVPDWWPTAELEMATLMPALHGVQAVNWRLTEFQAGGLLSQLEIYPGQQAHREAQYGRLTEALDGSGLPFRVVLRTGAQILYKVPVQNLSTIPTEALRVAFRRQVNGECNAPYPSMADPSSGLALGGSPWQFGHLGMQLNPGDYPHTVDASERLLMLPHDFLLRANAADHAIDALSRFAAWNEEMEVWAATL